MEIVLASASPRRRMLLQAAGLSVHVWPQQVDESVVADEPVDARVRRLSRAKALACREGHRTVVAADTLVALHGEAFGQPQDAAEAAHMLMCLSGHTHEVYTGVCVRRGARLREATVCTRVAFRALRGDEIDTYLQHNDVLDKAGAYAIQGGAASFVEAVHGPLDNVIGLPVRCTLELLQAVGVT
jgi:septum formation protein